MGTFYILKIDIETQFAKTGEYTFHHPLLNEDLTVKFGENSTDVDRLVKVRDFLVLTNTTIVSITNDNTGESYVTTFNSMLLPEVPSPPSLLSMIVKSIQI